MAKNSYQTNIPFILTPKVPVTISIISLNLE